MIGGGLRRRSRRVRMSGRRTSKRASRRTRTSRRTSIRGVRSSRRRIGRRASGGGICFTPSCRKYKKKIKNEGLKECKNFDWNEGYDHETATFDETKCPAHCKDGSSRGRTTFVSQSSSGPCVPNYNYPGNGHRYHQGLSTKDIQSGKREREYADEEIGYLDRLD